ncbi:MAG: hypothetical protein QNJ40_00870 [Xanthomonadales bacterium]|nr:hypothetical protein [Xanthomonadales bacterium]
MGLFDLPAPLFSWIDQLLAFLPALLRVALWGAVSGVLSMWLYALLSRQDALAELKGEIKQSQAAINSFDGEFNEMWPLIRRSLGLSLRHLRLALGPALWAGIPVIFVMAWISNHYGYMAPEAGAPVELRLTPAEVLPEALEPAADPGSYRAPWPAKSLEVAADAKPLFNLDGQHPTPVLHARQWWNWLIANPGGYLPAGSPLELVEIGLESRQLHTVGPTWTRTWPLTYFLVLVVTALGYKFLRRVH